MSRSQLIASGPCWEWALLLTLLFSFNPLSLSYAARINKPNVVYILADDLGFGDLGCYGQRSILTPSLDGLAHEGMRFTQHYAGSPVCAPSRCTLMTGKHTGHATRRHNRPYIPLKDSEITLAEIMKAAGYSTGVVGKWGLADTEGDFDEGTKGKPNQRGFDYWFGFLSQRHAWNYYPDFVWENDQRHRLNGGTYVQDAFTERALDFVEKHAEGPFFLYVAYTIPHVNNARGHSDWCLPVPSDSPYGDEEWPQVEKNFAAMVTWLDRDVGKILSQLEKLAIEDETIVMFSSDNGAQSYAPHSERFFDSTGGLRGRKTEVYEGGIRVPFIVRWPGVVKPDSESDHISAFWDLLPTLSEVVGQQAPSEIDGISFLPTLQGASRQVQHDYLYWEYPPRGYTRAIRQGRWKAVIPKAGDPLELYDLVQDVSEKSNVVQNHPQLAREFEELFIKARSESPHWKLEVE